jgi:transposase
MLPSVSRVYPNHNFIFQQDNCSVHTSQRVRAWLQNNNIHVLDWPSRSPDLNPIENMWGLLVRNIKQQRLIFRNRADLLTAITNAWHAFPQYYNRNL